MTHSDESTKPHTLTTEAWFTVKPIVTALDQLKPGEKLPVKFTLPTYANRTRHWLYRYFKEMNLKSLYRIRWESPVEFTIIHLEPIIPTIDGKHPSQIFTPTELFVQNHLLETSDPDEALSIIRQELDSGNLTDQEAFAAFEEWERVMGITSEAEAEAKPRPKPFDLLPPIEDFFGGVSSNGSSDASGDEPPEGTSPSENPLNGSI